MVGHSVKKAFKKLEAKTQRERKDRSGSSKLEVIDPSHELSQQRKCSSSSLASTPCMHSMGLQSNPELHTAASNWSSNASVYSFDSASVSSMSTSLAPDNDIDDDLDIMPYDFPMRNALPRRRSTGSSRAKSQQKLARILGWNTSFPQWKAPATSLSAESLRSPSSSASGRLHSPTVWEEDSSNITDLSTPDSMPDLKMRQYPTRRANSLRDYSTKSPAQPHDSHTRQFSNSRSQRDGEKPRRHRRSETEQLHRVSSPRSATSSRRNSNPNVHKPLPNTPWLPSFPSASPWKETMTMKSSSMPTSNHFSEPSPIPELSAEEASILLAQPEPTELDTEIVSGRVELPDMSTLLGKTESGTVRSKSPTQGHGGSPSSQVHDFGPGTTLSIIEEEPFDVEDLAKLKVFELPAQSTPQLLGDDVTRGKPGGGNNDSCPGLSPSSSLSSKRLRLREDETEASLESYAESTLSSNGSGSSTVLPRAREPTLDADAETEGEEIFVGLDDRRTSAYPTNMSGKSFLALDDETDDDLTDTEESYRNSVQSGESRFNSLPTRHVQQQHQYHGNVGDSDAGEDEAHRRSTSADTTKTAYTSRTTSTANTLVGHDPDYSTDLAKRMDWI